ncbi:aminotransferase class III-fold pyridoxal phosphate-dependent enzyme [Streptomyces noursei]|uniref:aminotransferase class III-fold pyridoxal phosphate-dependent enzyme n=1 Tax=Streptomyces noursei TaxID=1971 RepID=UPI0019B61D8B|nr:aminotransferase class III-fold pyridoxal phosphate-dependent enzyme [Streptomyces noursei]MCZ1013267.1 aminotransferase class III-fold pyridoxal phosphate-dependent enzyme [Streptomyces noursei]GGX52629.1 hypothetical protein GCM10010341_87500 [Streptomyces noursei]
MTRVADDAFASWSAPVQPEIVSTWGVYIIDRDGQRYLDLAFRFVFINLGHQHPKVVTAVVEQAQRLRTVAPPSENRRVGGGPTQRTSHSGAC